MTLEIICYPKGFKDCEGRDLSGTYTLLENDTPTIQFDSLEAAYEFQEELQMEILGL